MESRAGGVFELQGGWSASLQLSDVLLLGFVACPVGVGLGQG